MTAGEETAEVTIIVSLSEIPKGHRERPVTERMRRKCFKHASNNPRSTGRVFLELQLFPFSKNGIAENRRKPATVQANN